MLHLTAIGHRPRISPIVAMRGLWVSSMATRTTTVRPVSFMFVASGQDNNFGHLKIYYAL
jgi:hypothetical protein